MTVNVFKNRKWIAGIVADKYVSDGMVINFYQGEAIVAAVDSQCDLIAGSLPGDPMRREYGDQKEIKAGEVPPPDKEAGRAGKAGKV